MKFSEQLPVCMFPLRPNAVAVSRELFKASGIAALTAACFFLAACAEPPGTEGLTAKGVAAIDAAATPPNPQPAQPEIAAAQPPALPDVNPALAFEVVPGVTIIPDPRIAFVPNVGIIEGSEAVLVVDTGLGPENGRRVLEFAREIAGGRALYLTTTHFHPEHNFGAGVFQDEAIIIMNRAQAKELHEKGQPYIELFSTFGEQVAERLEGTVLVEADRLFESETTVDLGGREVIMREIPAHTRGDLLIYLPDEKIMFTGDMAEPRYFPIMPDADSSADRWIAELVKLEEMEPEIVVPGHGGVGGAEILSAARVHIEFMRERIRALAAAGRGQPEITELMVPAVTTFYPDWGNQEFLPFEVAIIYAEATGNEPELPSF